MNAVTFRNLDVVAVSLGCSGYGTKRAFLHIHLSDGKIVRFNDWDEKELGMLKDILNNSARVGIKKKRKYYYLQNIIANTPEQTITE
tara:strand:- start:63 stop:323 length:261 start_codon:yes stop_codon:yes gene_type:complete